MVQGFADRRMWRLLLARLHPDSGGDRELFLFACALRERILAGMYFDTAPAWSGIDREHFLRTWKETMDLWAVRNRSTLKDSRRRGGKLEVQTRADDLPGGGGRRSSKRRSESMEG